MFKKVTSVFLSWLLFYTTFVGTVPRLYAHDNEREGFSLLNKPFVKILDRTSWKDAVSPNGDGERDEIKVDYLALPVRVYQEVAVLNEGGQVVRKIFSGKKDELLNHQTWNGKGEGGATLPEGSYNIRITASNQNNQNSDTLALFLDRTKPVVVSTSPSEGETIGISGHDDDKKIELKAVITDNLSGFSEAELKLNGEKIEFDEYRGNELRKEISEKISLKKLKDGKNVFEVSACDRGRNRVVKQVAFYKGGIEIVMVEPANGARVHGTVTVKAKPARDSDLARIASIRYDLKKDSSVVLSQASSVSPFAGTLNTIGVADGEYDLLAVAKDKSGNEYVSPKIKITLDNTPPAITFNQANPSAASGSPFTISGKVADVAGIASLTVNGSSLSLGTGGTFSTSVPLVEGNNNFLFVGTDTVGNQSSVTFTATLDSLPPVITNITPITLTVFKSTPQTISFQVIDSSLASVRVNGNLLPLSPTSTYSTSLSLTEGANAFQITAEDTGHHSAIANATYILDSTPPVLNVSAPAAGLITSASQIRIQGSTADLYFKELRLNGNPVPLLGGNFDETVSLTSEGPNVFTLEASDFAGNKTTKTVSVIRDTTAPILSGISPADGSYAKTASLVINGNLTEANPDTLTLNGAPGSFPFTVSLSEGNNTFELVARDKAGNETRRSLSYIRDSVAPVLTVTAPSSSPVYTKETSFDIQGSFVEANFQGLTVNGVAVTPTGTTFSKTVSLVEGNNNLLIRVTDLAGNTDEKTVSLIRDTTLPVITLTSADDVTVSISSFTIAGTVTEANLSQITIDDTAVTLTGNQFSKTVTLASGQNQFRIKAKDLAGNETEKLLRVYFDDQPPVAVTGLGTFQNAAQIKVFWTTNASPTVAKYILVRSPAFPSGWPGVSGSGEVVVNSGNETSFTDPVSLRPDLGPNYTYIVKAVDASGRMSPAQSVSVTFGVAGQDVTGGTAADIDFDQVNLHFSPTSLPNSQTVNITVRVSAQTATNAPFVNAAKVYEFGPAGLSFQDPVLARIHFDPSVIPPGYVKEDIHVFFRHHPTDPWQTLPTVQLDKSGNFIYANIYQFSEITAGFLSAPKDSQTRFNVNTKLPELKIPDPLSGKTGIKLPQPNIFGTLDQEIPIVVPQGREGLTPDIKLSYDSTRGNGLLGVGWSLEKDFFQRSTRDGLPSYTSADTILFNSQELVITNSDATFDYYRLKRESAFLFIRHHRVGNYFEVIKDGVISKYGTTSSARQSGKSLEGLLGSFKWYLTERSRFSETANYHYRDLGGTCELSDIEYGGNNFKVDFEYETRNGELTASNSGDTRLEQESGIITTLNSRLSRIRISENTSGTGFRGIREYQIGYQLTSAGIPQMTALSLYSLSTGSSVFLYGYNLEYCGDDWGYDRVAYNEQHANFPAEPNLSPPGAVTVSAPVEEIRFYTNNVPVSESLFQSFKRSFPNDPAIVNQQVASSNGYFDFNGDGTNEIIRTNIPFTISHVHTETTNECHVTILNFIYDPTQHGDSDPAFVVSTIYQNECDPPQSYPPNGWDYIQAEDGGAVTRITIQDYDQTNFGPQNTDVFIYSKVSNKFYYDTNWSSIFSSDINLSHYPNLNGDGRPWHIVSVPLPSPLNYPTKFYSNIGTNFSSTPVLFQPTYDLSHSKYVGIRDINGDGKLDLVFCSDNPGGPNQLEVFLFSGSNFLQAPRIMTGLSATIPVLEMDKSAIFKDLNADGLVDYYKSDSSEVFINQGDHFEKVVIPFVPGPYKSFEFSDINGDGILDLKIHEIVIDTQHYHYEFDPGLGSGGGILDFDATVDLRYNLAVHIGHSFGTGGQSGNIGYSIDSSPVSTINSDPFAPNAVATWRDLNIDGFGDLYLPGENYTIDLPGTGSIYYLNLNDLAYIKRTSYSGLLKAITINQLRLSYSYSHIERGLGYYQTVVNGFTAENLVGGTLQQTTGYFPGVSVSSESPDYFKQVVSFDYQNAYHDRANHTLYGFGKVATIDALGNRNESIYLQDHRDHMGKIEKQISLAAAPITVVTNMWVVLPTGYLEFQSNIVYTISAFSTNSVTSNSYFSTNFTLPNGKEWSLCLPDKSSTTVFAPDFILTGESQKTTTEIFYYGINYGNMVLVDAASSADKFFLPAQKNTFRNDLDGNLDADDIIENFNYTDIPSPNGFFTPRPISKVSSLYGNNFNGERLSKEESAYDLEGREIRKRVWNGYKVPNTPTSGDKELTNSFVFDSVSSLLLAETNAKGVVSKYFYDATGRFLTQSTNTLGNFTIRKSEPVWGIVTNEIDTSGQTNWYRYDQLNRLRAVYGTKDKPDFTIPFLELTLDDFGFLSDSPSLSYSFGADSGANSATTRRKKFFDDSHLLPGETPYIEATAFADGLGRTIQTKIHKNASNDVISGRTEYDVLGRVIKRYDPTEVSAVAGYINYGISSGRTPFFDSTQYDLFGRPVFQGRGGVFSTSKYTGLYVTEVTDPRNIVKRSIKDIYGQVVRVEDFLGATASPATFHSKIDYHYDLRGNLLATVDGKGNQIVMGYDELGRKISMNDPDMGIWKYRYSDYGQLTNQTDAKNQKTIFEYDIRGQLTNKSYANTAGLESEVSYFYSFNIGKPDFSKLTNVVDGSGIESYSFDEIGSVTNMRKQIAGGGTFDTTYDYDALGRVRQISYPHAPGASGLMVRYEYRADNGLLNRIGKIANWNDPTGTFSEMYTTGINYDQKGRRADMTYGNDIKTSYQYDEEMSRLRENKVEKASTGFPLQGTLYAFDNNGNVLQKTETVEKMTHDYSYDELNRLVTAKLVHTNTLMYDHKYSYDQAGNILAKDVDSLAAPANGNRGYLYASTSLSTGATRPHAVSHFVGEFKTDLAASYDYSYDNNGNMTGEVITYNAGATLTRSKTMTWDADNLMHSVTADGVTTTMVYDHTGERTRKAVSTGKTTDYVSGLAQVDSSGEVLYFVFDGINRVASVKKVGAVAQTFFMHTDQLGSTTLVTSGNGSTLGDVTQRLDYKPFGEIFQQFVNGSWNIGFDPSIIAMVGGMTFTGQEMDETGLYYYGARFYDPNSGRFISSDTIIDSVFDTQGYSRYAYVHNNPINYSDPSGHRPHHPRSSEPPPEPSRSLIDENDPNQNTEEARQKAEEQRKYLLEQEQMLKDIILASVGQLRNGEAMAALRDLAGIQAQLVGVNSAIDGLEERLKAERDRNDFIGCAISNAMAGVELNEGGFITVAGIRQYVQPSGAAQIEQSIRDTAGKWLDAYLKELTTPDVNGWVAPWKLEMKKRFGNEETRTAFIGALVATARYESGLNPKQGASNTTNWDGTYDFGMMQVNQNFGYDSRYPNWKTDVLQNIQAASHVLFDKMINNPNANDLKTIFNLYNSGEPGGRYNNALQGGYLNNLGRGT